MSGSRELLCRQRLCCRLRLWRLGRPRTQIRQLSSPLSVAGFVCPDCALQSTQLSFRAPPQTITPLFYAADATQSSRLGRNPATVRSSGPVHLNPLVAALGLFNGGRSSLRVVRCLPSRGEVRGWDAAARAGVVQASREETAACPGGVGRG